MDYTTTSQNSFLSLPNLGLATLPAHSPFSLQFQEQPDWMSKMESLGFGERCHLAYMKEKNLVNKMHPLTFPIRQIFYIPFSSTIREQHLNEGKNTDVIDLFLSIRNDFAFTFAFGWEVEAWEGELFGQIWKDI